MLTECRLFPKSNCVNCCVNQYYPKIDCEHDFLASSRSLKFDFKDDCYKRALLILTEPDVFGQHIEALQNTLALMLSFLLHQNCWLLMLPSCSCESVFIFAVSL